MADHQLDQLDYYTLLGVEPTASTEDIRTAFRRFALRYHPDRHIEGGPEKVARATAIYRRGSEALETLVDPTLRRAYDIVLSQGEVRLTVDARAVEAHFRARTSTRSSAHPGSARRSASGRRRSQFPPAAAPQRRTQRELSSPSAKAFYARALQHMKDFDYRTALRMVENALQHEPGHPLLVETQRKLQSYFE